MTYLRPPKTVYKPPSAEMVRQMRERRLMELKMKDIIREVIFYLCFLIVLLIVGSTCIDSNAYNMRQSLDNRFTNSVYTKVCTDLCIVHQRQIRLSRVSCKSCLVV